MDESNVQITQVYGFYDECLRNYRENLRAASNGRICSSIGFLVDTNLQQSYRDNLRAVWAYLQTDWLL
ncbi:unnamed protein product [Arabidopsis thaliana]|uniref:(thale cress) hypothetical protein n=1 Tax=Arabidopsis thaliana TaxID=3702 RepID=A0A7G2DX77_ARATH|nr:unnamed protein product [Arabidopsis thaliana]